MTGFKVLVVDDEPFISRSLAFVLRKGNYQVFEARDGAEAMVIIESERPDLVFLDVMMPKRNGIDVCRAVRGDLGMADVHIVLLTAKGQAQDRETGLAAGANRYLTKPFDPDELLAIAREVLGAA